MQERERLIEILSRKIHPREGVDPAVVVADYLLDNDIVPVVRCRDCEYAKNAKVNKKGFRICPASHMEIVDDDYCSYGDREQIVKVYGVSDDLVEIEGSSYWEDEIDCYDKDVRIWFCDGTVIRIRYADGGIWRIEIEAQGTEKHRLDVCSGEDEDDYSDCFYINAEITSHAVINKED